MNAMQISGLGLVGGFGCGKQDLLAALERGSVPTSQVELRDHQFPLYRADTVPLENYLNKRALRRIDHFSRLALLGAYQALEDAGQPEIDRSRLGVVIGSGYGALQTTFKFLDSVLEDGDAFASPTAFSNSVHNAAAAHISIQLKITGPSLTVSQFDQSLVSSLFAAQQWLDEGRVDAVLLGVVDEYCSVLGYCWERFLGCCEDVKMQPFDSSRNSAIAGEGAAFFLLQTEMPDLPGYARIDGVDMGRFCGTSQRFSVDQPLILSCEGIAETVNYYRQQLAEQTKVACYSPLYGASPVTHAFDLAVGGLALQRGGLLPSVAVGGDIGGGVVTTELPCHSLSCLRLDSGGEYGAIHLKKVRG